MRRPAGPASCGRIVRDTVLRYSTLRIPADRNWRALHFAQGLRVIFSQADAQLWEHRPRKCRTAPTKEPRRTVQGHPVVSGIAACAGTTIDRPTSPRRADPSRGPVREGALGKTEPACGLKRDLRTPRPSQIAHHPARWNPLPQPPQTGSQQELRALRDRAAIGGAEGTTRRGGVNGAARRRAADSLIV